MEMKFLRAILNKTKEDRIRNTNNYLGNFVTAMFYKL